MFDGDWDPGLDALDLAYTILAVGFAFIFGFLVDFVIEAFIIHPVIYAMDLIRNAVVSVVGYVPNVPLALLLIWTSIVPAVVSAFLSMYMFIAMIRHKIDEAEHLLALVTLIFFIMVLVAFAIFNMML